MGASFSCILLVYIDEKEVPCAGDKTIRKRINKTGSLLDDVATTATAITITITSTGTLQSADLMMGKTAPESAFHLGLTVKFALFREPTRSQSVNRDRFFRRSLLVIGR